MSDRQYTVRLTPAAAEAIEDVAKQAGLPSVAACRLAIIHLLSTLNGKQLARVLIETSTRFPGEVDYRKKVGAKYGE